MRYKKPQRMSRYLTIGSISSLLGLGACINPEHFYDYDGDGFDAQPVGPDCNNEDPLVNPDAIEVCNGIDDDCNGDKDDNAVDRIVYYRDYDQDGFAGSPELACPQEANKPGSGLFAEATDCDDLDADVFPGDHEEICRNGVDDNCDGELNGCGVPSGTFSMWMHEGWMMGWQGREAHENFGLGATALLSEDGDSAGFAVLSNGHAGRGRVYVFSGPLYPPTAEEVVDDLPLAEDEAVLTIPFSGRPTDMTSAQLDSVGHPELIVTAGERLQIFPNVRRGEAGMRAGPPYIMQAQTEGDLGTVETWDVDGTTQIAVEQVRTSASGDLEYAILIFQPDIPFNSIDSSLPIGSPKSETVVALPYNEARIVEFGEHIITADVDGDGQEELFATDMHYLGGILGWTGRYIDIAQRSNADFAIWVEHEEQILSVTPAGDVNGDGVDDLAVGVGSDLDGPSPNGVIYFVTGLADYGSQYAYHAALHLEGSSDYSIGASVADVGDTNRDGYSDYLIGACWENRGQPTALLSLGWADSFGVDWEMASASFRLESYGSCSGFEVAVIGDISGTGGTPDGIPDWLFMVPDFSQSESLMGLTILTLGADW